jgi:hypothetical protein
MTQVFRGGDRWRIGIVARCLRCRAAAGLLTVGLLVAACSPALEWRRLQPEGWGVALSMPCRPAGHARQLPLAGTRVELRLMACSVDDHTFAIASAELADPARVGPALLALAAAARANVQGTADAGQDAAVPGMTPHPAARRWRVQGQLPDGRAVQEQVLVFAHGLRVFQATLVGPRADDALAQPFFDSIAILP